MKAVVAAFNQEKALVGAFSVIDYKPSDRIRMELFEALIHTATIGAERDTVMMVHCLL